MKLGVGFSDPRLGLLLMIVLIVSMARSETWADVNLRLEGSWIQGGAVKGQLLLDSVSSSAAQYQVFFDDQKLLLSDQGQFVFGFGRDAQGTHQPRVLDAQGHLMTQHQEAIQQRTYEIQSIQGISKAMMSPDADTLARIHREAADVRQARKGTHLSLSFLQEFRWPLLGKITGVYGSQRLYNGQPRQPHYGVDIAAPVGTLVRAPAAGCVTLAEGDLFYSGGTLILDHGFGVSSSFLHLQEILVQPGDWVEQGQVIAKVGGSGRSTGAHLDWRMNWFEQRLDPVFWVPPMPALKPE